MMTLQSPQTVEAADDLIVWHRRHLTTHREAGDVVLAKAAQRHIVHAYLLFRAARAAGRRSAMPGLYQRTGLPC